MHTLGQLALLYLAVRFLNIIGDSIWPMPTRTRRK